MDFQLDKKEILKLASTGDIYRRGVRYYEEERLASIEYNKIDKILQVDSIVMGNYKAYNCRIRFDISGVLLTHSCDCQSHIVWKGACKHVICTLIQIYNDSIIFEKENENLNNANQLINIFKDETYMDIEESLNSIKALEGNVKIKPLIIVNNGENFASFSIGKDRMYVIRCIEELIENMEKEEIYNYGKFLELKHSIGVLDNESKLLYDLIINNKENIRTNTKFFILDDRVVDEFFAIYENDKITVEVNGESNDILYTDKVPKIPFKIDLDEEEETVKISSQIEYNWFYGSSNNYLLIKDKIYKIEKTYSKALESLLLESNKEEGVYFDGDNYNRFIKYIYPVINKYCDLKIEEEKLEIYFDMPDKNIEVSIEIPERNNKYWELDEYFLEEYFKLWDFKKENNKYILEDDDLIYSFLKSEFEGIKDKYEIFISDDYRKKDINNGINLNMGIKIEGDLLNLSVDSGDYSFMELVEAIDSLDIKRKFYRFTDGSFIDIDNENFHLIKDISPDIVGEKSDKNFYLPKYKGIFLDDLLKDSDINFEKDKEFDDFIDIVRENKNLEFEIPKEIKNILRPYQIKGYKWLKTLSFYGLGGILADEMGLGKTIQIIALLLGEERENPSIIVCPTSLIYNWEKEIHRFAPSLKTWVLAGTPEEREEDFNNNQDVDTFIITYDTLRRDGDYLKDYKFDFVIIDEAQNIKNPMTKTAKAVKNIKGKNRFALTGTPIENSLSELWSIFDFIMPGFLYGYGKFQEVFESPIMGGDEESLSKLIKQTQPFILRRTKDEVLHELPEKTESIVYAELTPEQKKLYTAYFLKTKGELDEYMEGNNLGKNKIKILSQLTRLRQLCCHPSLFIDNYTGGSGKLNILMEIIETSLSSGNKILLFSQFTSMLKIIKDILDDKGVKYYYLDGGTSPKDRLDYTEKFNKGHRDIFLISLRAGGSGLNLTRADTIIHFDQWWNPAVMDQASDRAHRIGQKNKVQIYNIIAKDTIEEKIIELQNKKKDLSDSVILSGANFINQLGDSEIKEIFS